MGRLFLPDAGPCFSRPVGGEFLFGLLPEGNPAESWRLVELPGEAFSLRLGNGQICRRWFTAGDEGIDGPLALK